MRSAMRNRLANVRTLIRTPRVTSDKEILEIAQSMWEQLDTPLSLGLSLLARNGQIEDLLRVEIDPSRYLDSETSAFADDAQAIAFLRKMPLQLGVDREKAAFAKFLEAEDLCRQTNARIRQSREGGSCPPAVSAILHASQWKISRWLGNLDARSWALRCRFGPGADRSTRQSRVSAFHKLSRPSSTEDFADGAAALVYSHPLWSYLVHGINPHEPNCGVPPWLDIEIVSGNKLMFVPKTALIDRSIAIEPRLNIFAQLGLGALIRQRLKRNANLDLDSQTPSQELAYRGSLDGSVATIDLSSASDTLAKELVRDLLPSPWLTALEWCRSASGEYLSEDGQKTTVYYEKFSSMGNGYTFELESMIFYALALSCAEYCHDDITLVRAYGDDIAIPVGSVELLGEVLSFCGFLVNKRKSFSSGCFRESCGADFFNGKDVRPYYQTESLLNVQSLFRLANGLRRVAVRRNHGYGCDVRLRCLWDHVVRRIPPSLRALKGPFRRSDRFTASGIVDFTSDDSYLAVNLDEAMSSPYVRRNPDGWEGWLFACAIPSGRFVRTSKSEWIDLLVYALYTCRDGLSDTTSPHKDGDLLIPLRGEGPRKLTTGAFASVFEDVGPWI